MRIIFSRMHIEDRCEVQGGGFSHFSSGCKNITESPCGTGALDRVDWSVVRNIASMPQRRTTDFISIARQCTFPYRDTHKKMQCHPNNILPDLCALLSRFFAQIFTFSAPSRSCVPSIRTHRHKRGEIAKLPEHRRT